MPNDKNRNGLQKASQAATPVTARPRVSMPSHPGSADLCLGITPGKGRGVFALRPFPVGELIVRFRGETAPVESIERLDHWLQVGPRLFMGPSGSFDDYVNHSCQPNCGLFEEDDGPALRAIAAVQCGEEVSFDYSTWMSRGHWSLSSCVCGSVACRGGVDDFDTLEEPLKGRYVALGCVPEFVLHDLPHATAS